MMDEDLRREMTEIQGEAIGWLPLGERSYVHVADDEQEEILVVGVPDIALVGLNVLLLRAGPGNSDSEISDSLAQPVAA